ncbi:uncharacterized protein EI90DRAFT_3289907 [Cantharellus anzutake]|uniref:uncharacterized protein n=1 Tax=Cantharellus anzutake TaxID=1750568 RepID=UPI0019079655|nr:uncharacterized protein EI90DRAFT_3289907 [Cantharellus anzutake]KAF8330203.1 hypothetical protein EI90DRAFT_3289907 [Cantharellus anzutake]
MVVFSVSMSLHVEESGSSFSQLEWMAHPWDSRKGLYDYGSAFVTARLGSEEVFRALSLYQMPNEDYVQLQKLRSASSKFRTPCSMDDPIPITLSMVVALRQLLKTLYDSYFPPGLATNNLQHYNQAS